MIIFANILKDYFGKLERVGKLLREGGREFQTDVPEKRRLWKAAVNQKGLTELKNITVQCSGNR